MLTLLTSKNFPEEFKTCDCNEIGLCIATLYLQFFNQYFEYGQDGYH